MAGRPAVGLDIGTSSVRAAEVSFGSAGPTLQRFGQVALPHGAVRDGEVVDADAVASAVRELWSQAKFSTRKVIVGVANQRVIVRQAELAWLAEDELRRSLPFQVQDLVPMPIEQAILDYYPLAEFTDESGARMVRVLLVAAAREMVDAALLAVTKAGLRPVVVDLTGFAVLRALTQHGGNVLGSTHAEALIDIGASVTNIVVHQDRIPAFVRILLSGGADISEAVAERMGVPIEDAEARKVEAGLAEALDEAGSDPGGQAIESAAGVFLQEVRSSLDYYRAQDGSARISRLVLSGGGSMLTGLVERLAAATGLPVELAHTLGSLQLGRTGLTEGQLAYVEPLLAVPVGLALGRAS